MAADPPTVKLSVQCQGGEQRRHDDRGLTQLEEIARPRQRQFRNGVVFHHNEVEEAWIERDELLLDGGCAVFPRA